MPMQFSQYITETIPGENVTVLFYSVYHSRSSPDMGVTRTLC